MIIINKNILFLFPLIIQHEFENAGGKCNVEENNFVIEWLSDWIPFYNYIN